MGTRIEKVFTTAQPFFQTAKTLSDARLLKNPNAVFANSTWNAISFGGCAEFYLAKANDSLIGLGVAEEKRKVMLGYFDHFKEKLYETNVGGEDLTLDYMLNITRKMKRSLDAFMNAAEKNIREEGIANSYTIAALACAMKMMEETEKVYELVVKPLKKFGANIPKTMSSAFVFLDLAYYKASDILDILDPKKRSLSRPYENTEKTYQVIINKLLNGEFIRAAAKKAIENNKE